MGSHGKTMLTLFIAALFTLGAAAESAVATTTKKKAMVHKMVPRPTPPTLPTVKKTAAVSTVSPGVPTASKKALAVPGTRPARAAVRKTVNFGTAFAAGSLHNPGSVVVHVAQIDPHIELKP